MQLKYVTTHTYTHSEKVSICLFIPVNWEVELKEKGFRENSFWEGLLLLDGFYYLQKEGIIFVI